MPTEAPTWEASTETPTWEDSTETPTWEDSQATPEVVLTPENFQLTGPKFYQPSGLETTTELTTKLAEDLDKPLVQIIPELTPEEQKAMGEASPEEQRSAGYAQGTAQFINGLTSPRNLLLLAGTAGLGLPVAASRAVALGFAVDMGRQVPDLARQLGEEYAKPEAERDQQKIGQLISTGAGLVGFTALAGTHAAGNVTEAYKLGLDNARRLTSEKAVERRAPRDERQTVPPSTLDPRPSTVAEPMPWEMEYAGGEMPRQTELADRTAPSQNPAMSKKPISKSPVMPIKALSEVQFEKQYAQHIDLRIRGKDAAAQRQKILTEGFRKGANVNALPPTRGQAPNNVIERNYQPKKGDLILLAPKDAWKDGPNGMEIKDGWKPKPHEAIILERDNPDMYQEFLRAQSRPSTTLSPTPVPEVTPKSTVAVVPPKSLPPSSAPGAGTSPIKLTDSMGQKHFWAKTRKEIEREGAEKVKYLRGQRAETNKLTGSKGYATWRLKSTSRQLKADIESAQNYTKGLLEVHKERLLEALSEGKPVPDAVLKDYPDLMPKRQTPKPVETPNKVLKPGNVNTTADVQTAREAKPLGEGSSFSPKEAKEQKKFLLDAIDQAIAEAPEKRPTNPADADAQLLLTVKHWSSGDTKATFEAREAEVLDSLSAKYGVPREDPYKGSGVHYESLKERVDTAIKKAQTGDAPKVTIEVPGDGVFTIVNSKEALNAFSERAAKFPTTAPRAKTASTPRGTPTQPTALGKPDTVGTVRALKNTVSFDETRGQAIRHIWSDGKQSVSVNGRMLTLIRNGLGGTEKAPELFKPDGTKFKLPKGDQEFPRWQQVVPEKFSNEMKDVDTQKLFTVLRQAQEATSERSTAVTLWKNKDGSLGVTAHSPDSTSYVHNYFPGAKPIMAIDPALVLEGLNAARSVGDGKVRLRWTDELAPLRIEHDKGFSVIMPMRLGEGVPFWSPETPTAKAAKPSKGGTPSGGTSGSGYNASANSWPHLNFPKLAGGVDAIRPMETPEILKLAVELSGSVPNLKRLKKHAGFARAGKITLDERAFADPQNLAMLLAHELGHVNDWFPEGTMKRGNVIGRLIGSVNTFLKGTFGNLNNKELREELVALTKYWHPWDRETAPDHYRKYRDSAVELYAEAVSVLLNSPGLLEQKAPKFYKAFFEHLDAKPKFKEEFFALQDLLARGPEAVLGRRLAQSREGFEKGEAMLHEKIQLRQAARNSFKDFLTKVRIQSLDIADFVRRRIGSKDPRQGSEFDQVYEEWKLDDNKNAADIQRVYHEMIQPVVKAGLDEHAFGQVLELQRIMGSLDAYRDMQTMRQTLGPDKMAVLKDASKMLEDLERQGLADELGGAVIEKLEKAGIDPDLIDRYRQLATEQGTRAEIANSQARSPILAEAELKHLLETVTPEQRAALEQSAAAFRQLIFDRATEAKDVGIISQATYDATIVPNKENYAAFRPLDKIEPFVSPMVRRARGSLKDIENPFITTLLKLQSLNNLIELQRVKNTVRDQMHRLFPEDMKPAEVRWTGRRREAVPAKPGEGRLKVLENGRLVEYSTDPYVAKMFDQLTPTDSFWLNKVLEVPFRMGIYPLIIKYNPGFLFAFNPRRDMARTIRNLYATAGVTRRELLPNYASPEVWRAVSDYLEGRPNPLAQAMIRNKAITTSWQGFSRMDQQDVMTDLLRRYKLAGTPQKSAAARALMWLPTKINEAGSFLEALPKFASYKTLIERGTPTDRAAFLVRNYAGTPNFKVKGEFANVSNSYVPFMNIFLQGWRSDLKLATNPKTAGGFWMQWMLQHGWQAAVVGLAAAGVFGSEIKRLYDGISEYDKTNYGTLPLGEQRGVGEFGNKTVYLRTPRDETSRFFSAMTYKATRAAADQIMGNPPHAQALPVEMFAFGAGVTPSPTPVLNVAGAWKDYLSGRNPIDPFRNQPVIGAREFKAGGLPALGEVMTWTLGQSGLLNLFRWNPQSETTTEAVMSGAPVLNRLVKISDQGHRELQRDSETMDAQAKAKLRVQYNDTTTALVAQHAWLQSLGADKRTPEQQERYGALHDWKTRFYDLADAAAWDLREDKGEQRKVIGAINAEAENLKVLLKPK